MNDSARTSRAPAIGGLVVGLAIVVASFAWGPSWIFGAIFFALLAGWIVFAIRDRRFP